MKHPKFMEEKEIRNFLTSKSIFVPNNYFNGYAIINIQKHQLIGCIKMCGLFKNYFDESEFGKLVCKKILTYSRIHVASLSANNVGENLPVTRYAIPCKELPKVLFVSCDENGQVTYCNSTNGRWHQLP